MVFSDTSGLGGLVEDIDFICTTDATSYPLKDKARNMNRHLYVAICDYLKATKRASFDDPNNTGLPISTFTLVDQQVQYSLPTNLLKVEAIEVKDNAGNWTRLQELDKSELARSITDFENTPGIPRYYDIVGENIFLYPAAASGQVTLSDGGKIHYSREIDAFTSTDTTQEPGIPELGHRIVSLGASCDYLAVNAPTERYNKFKADYETLRMEFRKFCGDRLQDATARFRPAHSTNTYL